MLVLTPLRRSTVPNSWEMVPILAHERLEVSGETFHSRFVPCQDDRTDGAGARSFGFCISSRLYRLKSCYGTMTGANETLVAAAAVLQSLARDEPTRGSVSPAFNFEFPATNNAKSSKLPGEHSPAKVAFEAELEALISRVHHLEIPGCQSSQTPRQPPADHPVYYRIQREVP